MRLFEEMRLAGLRNKHIPQKLIFGTFKIEQRGKKPLYTQFVRARVDFLTGGLSEVFNALVTKEDGVDVVETSKHKKIPISWEKITFILIMEYSIRCKSIEYIENQDTILNSERFTMYMANSATVEEKEYLSDEDFMQLIIEMSV